MTLHDPIQTDARSENLFNSEKGEVTFVELLNILMRRKKLVIVIMIIVQLTAAAYLWQVKTIYEGKVIVQIGFAKGKGNLESMKVLKLKLPVEYPKIKSINVASDIISISTQANTQVEVEQQLKKITDQLLQKHKVIYDAEIAEKQKRDDFLSMQIDNANSQIAEITQLIGNLKGIEPAQASILVLEKNGLRERLATFEQRIINQNYKILPTKFIGEPTIKDIPVKARMVITVSIVLGLMLSVFGAFIVEYIIKARQEMDAVG